ncbi:iron-containing alcohol dehydrogenase [Clostridium luticellarii]|jgi:alcohol dehydrogenase YqhD (iron-dependent ADH family)|uniref:NADH-dependent butanol dehydrogenase A n=1 Tax=Clostridium luticellarii TaxID=1691940 RepID=A0A2T0BN16_9CLOT|nr:iron-containing alcohol dehydrogenase [Clostridium luticellarii]MCI1945133.1 iron-containing alcohol dehydrogenase [Clostridium luticellarii]MCI1968522.1 iron-containing alcohol dehydrogenase [Clostridium luticellarii]MCI1995975.1 iron-containing alcohol dehydrogenase [Clostridium luticellarii]MCI2040474.1 iron-containing alcohol dehydrogenase [Clostridium luticellarii]PRR85261.1 NADH-dependent butanol dehydrogenase A [Clostridium luticellarii]
MENFIFKNATEIIFGRDTERFVGSKVKEYSKSKKILFCYGGGSIKRSGLYDRVVKSLKENGIEFIELPGIKPNPRLGPVKEGIKICRENDIKFILSVGGGSAADTAKAIGVGVPYEGDVWDFYCGKAEVKESLPVGVVITLPATGTEASNSSVIMNEDGWYKKGLNTVLIRPAFSIMNPELTFTLPAYQTACGAADIMAHIMERYFTNVKHVDLTDRLCEAALRTVINNAPIVLKEPENYDARAEIMWTGTIAHNDSLSTGRIGDWASHKIEHELSGETDIAHGAGLAIVFPAWMKYVYKHDINRFVQFAVRVWDVDLSYNCPEDIALEGIKRLTAFFKSMGLPTNLKEGNIPEDKIEEMADKCTDNDTKTVGQFVKIGKEDVVKILNLAK